MESRASGRGSWLARPALCGFLVVAVGCGRSEAQGPAAQGAGNARATSQPDGSEADLAALREEVARLRQLVPSQSHGMQDVGYHYTNLWFAGQKANWPLATFYLNETRSHLKWAVRLRPVRKTQAGDVDLEGIREAFDTSSLADLQHAIEAKDAARFAETYRLALEGCYACHKASEKPFLRPQVPSQPEQHIINYDPKAKWPQ